MAKTTVIEIEQIKARNHNILRAVIQAYIEMGAPVGSVFLCEKYRFGVSSATIRNVMAELEAQGLITHPHTSAGRVPTDLGYRYYVDLLMEPAALNPEEVSQLAALHAVPLDSFRKLLEQAAGVLSELTGAAAVVLVPELARGTFKRFQLIPVEPTESVGVLITSEGMVRHAFCYWQEPVSPNWLLDLAQFINEALEGAALSRIDAYLQELELLTADPVQSQWAATARAFFEREGMLQSDDSLILSGMQAVLSAPEFRSIERTHRLMQALQDRQSLTALLRRDLSANGVKLHIGGENKGTFLEDCSVVSAPYRHRGGITGAIGVLGPTRLDYPRITGLVQRMAESVTQALEN